MADLLELASRVEAATGPDRELDDAIFAAMGLCKHRNRRFDPPTHEDDIVGPEVCVDCGKRGAMTYPRRHYTASLDAAMTLVPEGWRWLLREAAPDGANPDESGFLARLETHDFETVTWGKGQCWITDHIRGRDAKSWAATPSLALTAAALRANGGQ